jgi:hypothetical protein
LSQSCSDSIVPIVATSRDSFGTHQETSDFNLEDQSMTTFTPSAKGSFIAGIGFWSLLWAALYKADDFAEACRIQHWFSSERCFRWIRTHKATSLLGTELFNYGTHGIDPLGVSFALGGTLTNLAVICVLLPMLDRAKGGGKALNLQF